MCVCASFHSYFHVIIIFSMVVALSSVLNCRQRRRIARLRVGIIVWLILNRRIGSLRVESGNKFPYSLPDRRRWSQGVDALSEVLCLVGTPGRIGGTGLFLVLGTWGQVERSSLKSKEAVGQ
ncbi:hypothetical protein K440DRAFT_106411 [Wilcoxina mikolae CBS 423.85]|nr:hypothetical protein K440DRAFT_106411 [Wilcoxina mikolae CBS 423.85]